MAKRVCFSFHYDDVANFRANVVRNSWMTKPNREDAGFFDASLWEQVKKEGNLAIKRLINKGLRNTSVTTILAGSQTFCRPWVQYEILESFKKGNALLTIYIHNIKDKRGMKSTKGPNPLDYIYFRKESSIIHLWQWRNNQWEYYDKINYSNLNYYLSIDEGTLSKLFPSYDWVNDNGYANFGRWIDEGEKLAL
jgi:hypothetical protein